ncbi:hypothetical protein L916_17454 [Plasmopara halstedii]|uniref:RING-type domain-containing protein n=1 Tax=Plasmopara halstedii TaxID=4781 RepID=A0A0N7L3T6_PLAHL|nr:hypothetical protein L916_17454 [Plasmopara halstedii]CEG36779.1 hypothetical protein L916_17454 [Plasmopara halstedii]|eukprot:XP_024573148.1 hypothetical protein L916_17454 [Plasmopara halstedii]
MDQRINGASSVNTDTHPLHIEVPVVSTQQEAQTGLTTSVGFAQSPSELIASRSTMGVLVSDSSINDTLARPHSREQRSRSDTETDRRTPYDLFVRGFTERNSSASEESPTRLTTALSTPVSGDAVTSRLLQALPQLAFGQFLQDLNNQTPPWRGFAGGRTDFNGNAAQEDETERTLLDQDAYTLNISSDTSSNTRSASEEGVGQMTASDNSRESDGTSIAQEGNLTRNSDEDDDEQTAMDELQAIFRRCHNSLPFIALFFIYFAYQHATGILVFGVGTVAVMGLDQRLRAQVALKDKANTWHLVGIVVMCAINMVALCSVDGQRNPLPILHSDVTEGSSSRNELKSSGEIFWHVLWTVLVNDFLIRLWSVIVKAFVAGAKSDRVLCERKYREEERTSVEQHASIITVGEDEDERSTMVAPLAQDKVSTAAFYRRKRKLYGLIEMCSIFLRSLLASIPWCSLYQVCASKFMADVFTFAYLVIKGLILAAQGRRIIILARSFKKLGLEFGVYVPHDEVVESGSPDCSICYERMRQPVKLACSHIFCEECVTEWFDHERSCPLCRATVGGTSDDANVKPKFLDGRTSLVPQLL